MVTINEVLKAMQKGENFWGLAIFGVITYDNAEEMDMESNNLVVMEKVWAGGQQIVVEQPEPGKRFSKSKPLSEVLSEDFKPGNSSFYALSFFQ